jgi:hypothetical protein
VTGPSGPTGPAGASHAYTASTQSVSIVTGPSVFPTTIVSASVPAGNYVVSVSGEWGPRASSTSNEADCTLDVGATTVASQSLLENDTDESMSYAITGAGSLASAGSITFACASPTTTAGVSVGFGDNSLVASLVGAIN